MTHGQHMNLAREFAMVQKSLDDCWQHGLIQHHMKAAGIEFKKYVQASPPPARQVYSCVHEGDEVRIANQQHLINYLG